MPIDFLILSSLTISILFGVPLYITFRNHMVQVKQSDHHFSRRRVFQVTFTNILLNSFIGLHILSLFLYIYNQQIIPIFENQLISLLFLLSAGITFYGMAFTSRQLFLRLTLSHI